MTFAILYYQYLNNCLFCKNISKYKKIKINYIEEKCEQLLIIREHEELKNNIEIFNQSILKKAKDFRNNANQFSQADCSQSRSDINNNKDYYRNNNYIDSKFSSKNHSKLANNTNTDLRNPSIAKNPSFYDTVNLSKSLNIDHTNSKEDFDENYNSSKKDLTYKNFNKFINDHPETITEEDSFLNNNFLTYLASNINDIHKTHNIKKLNENLNEDIAEIIEQNEYNEYKENDFNKNNSYIDDDNINKEYNLEPNAIETVKNLKFDFLKDSVIDYFHMKQQKLKSVNNNSNSRYSIENPKKIRIDLFAVKNLFYEKTENSDISYKYKELILRKSTNEHIGNILYSFLLESQKNDLYLFQEDLFGDIYFT